MVLEVSHETGHVDDCHDPHSLPRLAIDSAPSRALPATIGSVDVHAVLAEAAEAIRAALGDLDDWGLAGTRPGQYFSDLAADQAALAVLTGHGLGVLSEESGRHHPDRAVTVVLDPVDGSTNASRGIPWFATSLCAVDEEGPLAALVINLASGTTFVAERGAGATVDGRSLRPSSRSSMGESLVALSGFPGKRLGWYQYRALGAAALDLCAVAGGVVDAYIDCSWDAHGPWDYLGGMLVCTEAGGIVTDATNRELVVLDHDTRRTPVAAGTTALHAEAMEARQAVARDRLP
jgi:fructose-1,6-bisphosphatase/inositol monophosphatase family enzyme